MRTPTHNIQCFNLHYFIFSLTFASFDRYYRFTGKTTSISFLDSLDALEPNEPFCPLSTSFSSLSMKECVVVRDFVVGITCTCSKSVTTGAFLSSSDVVYFLPLYVAIKICLFVLEHNFRLRRVRKMT